MCGRYSLSAPGDLLAEVFDLPDVPSLAPRYNVAPTQEAAVVRQAAPGAPRRLDLLRWGLVPAWAEGPHDGSRRINARFETVASRPSFRDSLRRQRCLVPADGFYEWRRQGRVRQPFHIRRPDRRPLAMAGLWASWRQPGSDAPPLESFTVLTCPPNATVAPLHDRMPLVLPPAAWDVWLAGELADPRAVLAALPPLPDDAVEAVPVSRLVNSPHHDEPGCLAVEPGLFDER